MTIKKIAVHGEQIACLFSDTNREPALLFLHGAGCTNEVWNAQWQYFKDRERILIPSLPGHGDSSGRSYDTIDAYANIILELTQKEHIDRFVLIGHSMGGAIAQHVALQNPELLAALILVSTGARLRVAPQVFSAIETDYSQYIELASNVSMFSSVNDRIRFNFKNILSHSPSRSAYNDFTACDRFDVMNKIDNIKTKTLILVGDRDIMTPPKYAIFLNQKINSSRLEIIKDAGHMVMMEKPEEVNKAIENFLTPAQ
jgi:pimeloyl-ACP methyl ester carboxylesterase